jgi:hypothetical protein
MKNALDTLVTVWMSNDSFRAEFRSNPEAAAKNHGIELDAEMLAVAQSIQSIGAPDLEARISMDQPTGGC